ncbi:hypothetical protein JDV02_007141 [Purpureocillium takamizusanense]|uniref:Uncharacterized protein n=1 Tax=Purpureocillium takamizusanense TaxID=2060973 RepID=A0A9Q8VDQ8_9HYPO|nr:uncharacterized protein JDV02_007141 [Purpureocillium takamizusanense]UNI21124.1 hypothetical protein JDV02_007141 [Purpureocillium takamizusanense]
MSAVDEGHRTCVSFLGADMAQTRKQKETAQLNWTQGVPARFTPWTGSQPRLVALSWMSSARFKPNLTEGLLQRRARLPRLGPRLGPGPGCLCPPPTEWAA